MNHWVILQITTCGSSRCLGQGVLILRYHVLSRHNKRLQSTRDQCATCNRNPPLWTDCSNTWDAFSFISEKEKFNNPSICLWATWWETWVLKDNAMRARMSRSLEKLIVHAWALPCLSLGDRVFIQNQQGQVGQIQDSHGAMRLWSIRILDRSWWLWVLDAAEYAFMQVHHPHHSCDWGPPQPAATVY